MTGWPGAAVLDRAADLLGPGCIRQRPLGPLTTYRVGGPAAIFLEIQARSDLEAVHHALVDTSLPILVVGRGSNLLVADAGFPGIAITLGHEFESIVIGDGCAQGLVGPVAGQEVGQEASSDHRWVSAGGATFLPVLARRCAAAGVGGLEWAVGIPGSLGGGVCMNAGGHGGDISSALATAEIYDLSRGQEYVHSVGELGLAYRHSELRADQVVLGGSLTGVAADPELCRGRIAEIVRWRREHQPGGANAGSVFVNPDGDTAGRLVEAVGCKGFRIGSAQVSTRHANFIQADEGGSADDVATLIGEVRRRVAEQTGIYLRLECRLAGLPSMTLTRD